MTYTQILSRPVKNLRGFLKDLKMVDPKILTISLNKEERELLLEELGCFISSLGDTKLKTLYMGLRNDISNGEVTYENIQFLENLLELTLQSGHVRRQQSPQAEKSFQRIFYATPRGAAVKKTITETNKALSSLKGQELDTVSFAPRTPGSYRLVIDTKSCKIDLEITNQGLLVKSVEIGI